MTKMSQQKKTDYSCLKTIEK